MVTLAGARNAAPLVAQIDTLNAAVAALAAALTSGLTINQIILQCLDASSNSSMISISFPLNAADSNAIFNDIKNVLGNDVNITTNSLGAIT